MDNFFDVGLGNYAILKDNNNKNYTSLVSKWLWRLYFDCACAINGANIGVLIESPNSRMKPYAYKLEFEFTNNKDEY